MMYELSDAAVRYVYPLMEDKDENVAYEAKKYIEEKENHFQIMVAFTTLI